MKRFVKRLERWNHLGSYKHAIGVMDKMEVIPILEVNTDHGCAVNYNYLREIINICKEYLIKHYFRSSYLPSGILLRPVLFLCGLSR